MGLLSFSINVTLDCCVDLPVITLQNVICPEENCEVTIPIVNIRLETVTT